MHDITPRRVYNWFDSEGNSGTFYPPGFFGGKQDARNNYEWCSSEAISLKGRGDVCMARSKEIQAAYWLKRIPAHG